MHSRAGEVRAPTGVLDALAERLGTQALRLLGVGSGLALLVASILSTNYRFDDQANKDVRVHLAASGQSLWDLITYFTSFWITDQGRFFPGSVAWTLGVFYVFDTRIEYKLVLSTVIVLAVAVAAAFVFAVSKSTVAMWVTLLALVSTLQIRNYFDGLIAFAGLLPLTMGLTLLAVTIVLQRRSVAWNVAAGLLYLAAALTYETVVIFAPVLVTLVLMKTRTWQRALPLVVPAIIQIAITLFLRLTTNSHPGTAYTVHLNPSGVFETFLKQLVSAVPLSQWIMGYQPLPAIPLSLILLTLLVVGVPTFLAAWSLSRRVPTMSARTPLYLSVTGAWIWLSSTGLIAITERWQVELAFGQGYLGVIYGYFGLSLVLTSAWLALARTFAEAPGLPALVWAYSSSCAIAVVCSLTVAGNLAIVS